MRHWIIPAAFALLGFTEILLAAGPYPRPELLLEPSELAKAEIADQFVILDARTRESYDQAHLPGARWVDHEAWKSAFDQGTDAESWSRRIAELGIGQDSKVVIYDDQAAKDAARIWWLLRYWGVADARLLNGGWKAWTDAERPTTADRLAPPQPVAFTAKPAAQRLATKGQVLDLLSSTEFQVVDARSEGEFCGLDPGRNKRGGAIPSAKHLEWSDLIDPETQRFKSAAELGELLERADIDLARPTATHCQSGGRASVMAFGLELMGAKDVRNYYKGWSEWGNAADTPIEPGKPK